jgi:predicted O-linked N-acetylglucosamine transferase (SPINDLY family)
MLHAVGLPELICNSILEYHSLALTLFHDPKKLTQTREHLTSIRMTSPLFDAKQFAANLERAYTLMAARNREGLDPATIYLR